MLQLELDFRDLSEKMAPGSIVSVRRDLDRNGKYYNITPEDKDILRKGTSCIILRHEHKSKDKTQNTWLVSAVGHDEPWIVFAADIDVLFLVKHPKKKVGYWDDPDFPEWYYEA